MENSQYPATGPIVKCLERWKSHLRGELEGGLDTILHPDCVFLSPVVFTPQVGRDITKLYLSAAGNSLGGEEASDGSDSSHSTTFGYTKEIAQGHQAMLEFETSVDGKHVNGVDIITCDDDHMITEFRVMIRPLQAINTVHAQMKAALEQMN